MLAPWLAWAVVRTFGLDSGGRVVPAMAFTPLALLSSVVPLVVVLALRRWAVLVLWAVVAGALLIAVLPRALAGPNPPMSGGIALRVMTANLYQGRGDPATIVALVREHRVDVLSLQELTPEEVAKLDAAGLRRLLPYRDVDARGGASGTGLFASRPLRRLPQINALGLMAEPRALVRVDGAPPVEIEAVHPPPPLHAQVGVWRRMLREIPAVERTRPTLRIVAGDFNATLDHRELRRVLDRGFVDAADATGQGLRTTWPAGRRLPPEITIDHVLIDPRIAARALSVHTVRRSDHRAVIATLELPPAAG
ncbi:MAG TPA: endonuclease/exonuclease/phosphatase family protein [Baekduia sp.]|nr:endonuclease/exonuclease/phosphatase family protein [Baekduia sp.]